MKSPKIRFKEFQNEWDLTTLGDIFDYIRPDNYIVKSDKYSKNYNTPVLTANKAFILGYTNEKNTFNKECVIFDDFTLDLKYVNFPFMVKSSALKILVLKEKSFNFGFCYELLKKANIEILGHARHYISVVQPTKTRIPSDIKEQEAIGEFFRKIDEILDLEKLRFKKFENFKKTMLDKLFVASGENAPRLRLGSFTSNWTSVTLGEVFKERTERSAVGELLSVSISNGVTKFSELNRWDKSSEDKSNYKVVKKGDIAYNSMRMWQGASGISKYNGIVSPAYTILEPCKNTNSLFFSYMFKKDEMLYKFRVKSQGLTSDTWNLKYTNLKGIKTKIPTDPKEQEAIGEFFKKIDEILKFKQQRILKFENIKKYLLNKMFM
ncbi:restriction endonuclease subunit S [Campylobacter hyointestinalis subsp. hyointestinalis]|uniref:Type I restriction-modification system, specificity subunit S n=1 Tax=Campylobacter hyointestinalis subsp. hyointestinalis TaxID=91352 RepID=A0A9W5EVD2_CAMHY|nr:restriction endonuclease subunit S [Campylobacter hyointestinalis]PPB68477.1 type I restriction endonuclease [Campylobacter hyointestinalis subsp. hyointestinalis]QCU00635.1 restriction endonuclease subunit S [Campylobacter hyointestinalis subsp. hyointestinalis]CUU71734.1 Type I restriction-modification system%2C specificity subunit S [Campylobacter hyointestinalis subsp. hyointestinalis]CUU78143.1 Type I restriction-modification system%2C specificity subunit S [Campylobacter hyointestinali